LADGKYVPGPHSLFGSTTGTGEVGFAVDAVDSNDSYIRMAWDTGGAAWDLGVVQEFGSITSPEANALRDAFVDSLGDQILRAESVGDVFRVDEVLLALNVGGSEINAGEAGIFRSDDGTFTVDGGMSTVETSTFPTSEDIDIVSNSIPVVDFANPKPANSVIKDVFRSARGESTNDFVTENVQLSIDSLDDGAGNAVPFEDGRYIVELFFAEIRVDNFAFFYDSVNFIGKWTFDNSLANGKYAIHLGAPGTWDPSMSAVAARPPCLSLD